MDHPAWGDPATKAQSTRLALASRALTGSGWLSRSLCWRPITVSEVVPAAQLAIALRVDRSRPYVGTMAARRFDRSRPWRRNPGLFDDV
jgi:hypothetical protein